MKKLVAISAIALSCTGAMAQNDECAVNYSIYKEFLNVESYSNALPQYRKVLDGCPQFSKTVYSDGIKIYKGLITQTQDQDAINAYIDTIKIIYEKRIANFGDEASQLSRCGSDIMKYRKGDTAYLEAYHIFARSIKASAKDPELAAISPYFQLAVTLYAKNKIGAEELFDAIVPNIIAIKKVQAGKDEKYNETLGKILTSLSANLGKTKYQDSFDKLFDSKYTLPSGIADVEILQQAMSAVGCDGCNLYAQSAEKLYETKPDASAAAAIARYNRKAQNYEKAAKYYSEAVEGEMDPVKKSQLLYESAMVANYRKKYAEAISLAKKSVEANSQNGASYLLIGAVYGANANLCTSDAFVRREIYWVAADYVIKAKKADPKLESDANSLLKKYAALYPDKEDAFMHSVKPGDVVKVAAFDTEVTTARF